MSNNRLRVTPEDGADAGDGVVRTLLVPRPSQMKRILHLLPMCGVVLQILVVLALDEW